MGLIFLKVLPDNKPLYNDADLLSMLWKDDRRGLEILFKMHLDGLVRFVYLMVKREDLSKDIVLEAYFKLWKIRHNLSKDTLLKPYLYKAAKNLALNKIKAEQRQQLIQEAPDNLPSQELGMDQIMEGKELQDKISRAIALLPAKRRLIFNLSRFEGLTYMEIADYLDISIKTVENQMSKALKTLREYLKPYLKN
ncbi:MAG: RNA polymerase sigma factor [Cyclobacteriaceae bacterium]